jgi:N6-adenosine-specific RNA methylase IME4
MDLEAIKSLPVADVAAKNAHLYLWVPNALLPEGMEVMKAWGFRYISNVVWAKRRKDGGPDGRGVGFYFRNVTELVLFGVRGSMRTLAPARSQVNMIETRKREHSRKPDEQYDLIESCSPGPYLEMFARHGRPGWTVWGDESLEDVAPRGVAHKGYAGGPIDAARGLPDLRPSARMTTDQADAVSQHIEKLYVKERMSVRDIAAASGYSQQRVYSLLDRAGVQRRPRGRTSSKG